MGVYTQAFLSAFKPKPIISVSEWADANRVLTTETSSTPGKWRTSFTPYLREPMDECSSPDYQHIVLMFASQLGKSEALNNVCAYYIDQEPSPQMMVQPTLQTAKEYSQIRISPMIKASPSLSGKVIEDTDENRRKTDKDKPSMFYKPYAGGYLVLSGSNSPASLASKPIRILLRDEIDRFPDEIAGEGSPLELSEQRARTFYNRKIIDSSTPLELETSKINELYEKSDKRNYFVPCPHCGEMQVLDFFQNVIWNKNGTDEERSKTAKIICISCHEVMKGSGRADSDWIGLGEWRKTAVSDIAGFQLNALYSPLITLQEIVMKWLTAAHKRSEELKQVFYNLMLGLPYDKNKQHNAAYEELEQKRRTTYDAELHENILCLTAGVDVQDGYLVGECVGWSHDHESYGVEYKIFAGDPSLQQVWNELDEWLLRPRYYRDGSPLNITVTCIDSGGHHTSDVYKFCKARENRHVYAIKGSSQADKPFLSQPSKVGEKKDTLLFLVGVNAGKSAIMSALELETHGPLYCHFPREVGKGYDIEYFKGLKSEKYVIEFKNGVKSGKWVKIYDRNEPLDCRNYAMLAREILKPPYAELQRLKDEGKQAYVVKEKPAAQQQKNRRRQLGKGATV